MIKKILRYVTFLIIPIYLLPMLVDVWMIKETVTTNNYASESFRILSTPNGYLQNGVKFNNGLLTTFGVLVIASLVISGLIVVVFVLNDLKITKVKVVEKYLCLALVLTTFAGIIIGIIALLVNAKILVDVFGVVAKLCAVQGFYIFTIGGSIFSVLSLFVAGKSNTK